MSVLGLPVRFWRLLRAGLASEGMKEQREQEAESSPHCSLQESCSGGLGAGGGQGGRAQVRASPPHLSGCLLSPTQTGLRVPQEAERRALATAQELQERMEGCICKVGRTGDSTRRPLARDAQQSCPKRPGPRAACRGWQAPGSPALLAPRLPHKRRARNCPPQLSAQPPPAPRMVHLLAPASRAETRWPLGPGFMLCCHQPEVLNQFWTRNLSMLLWPPN